MSLLDTFQAAERTGLARATLAKLRVVGGGPPFVKLGTKVLYEDSDLAAWITAKGKCTSTARVRGRPRAGARVSGSSRAA
jgi:hypothetical protein